MISLHTNISSLITQNNMTTSTSKLNTAIERMSTGSKINHASDNAANYSIATNMSNQISSYEMAADNLSMGMNLVSVAQETISQMHSRADKLYAMITQARNGTYGNSSLNAINLEAAAIISEIDRIYKNAEYDGIGMIQKFKPEVPDNIGLTTELTPRNDGFLVNPKSYNDAEINALTHVKELETFEEGETYAIGDLDDLIQLRTLVNEGQSGKGSTFVMCADIDLSSIDNWTCISNFNGTFDGNGHVISNLKQTISGGNYGSGLFKTCNNKSVIKNLGITNANINLITGKDCSILCGYTYGATISNCFVKGNITASDKVSHVGAISGYNHNHTKINDSYFEGNINGSASDVGGINGLCMGGGSIRIVGCYVKGNISGKNNVGGLTGTDSMSLTNCLYSGNVSGKENVGGLFGSCSTAMIYFSPQNCEIYGTVSGVNNVGGIAGKCVYGGSERNTKGVLCEASVVGNDNIGGLIGYAESWCSFDSCMMLGNVTGSDCVGGIIGKLNTATNIAKVSNFKDSSFYGDLTGTSNVGNIAGAIAITPDGTNFSTVNFDNCTIVENEYDKIGCTLQYDGEYSKFAYDTSDWESNINISVAPTTKITLQTGIFGANTSQIKFDLGFEYDLNAIKLEGCTGDSAFTAINTFINTLAQKETELGAITNRLDSATESIAVSMDNLVRSRSTIQDADLSKVSSDFIRQQILQQACATLMSTANQSPSIALQLL